MTSVVSSRSQVEVILETICLIPIFITALIGNILVLAAIYRNPKLRTSAHYFIATLSLTDLLSACISQPLTVTALMSGRWLAGTFGCQVQGFFNSFLTYTSSYTMVLIAINRYHRVVKPQFYKRRFSRNRVVILLLSMFVVNFVVVLVPILSGWGRFEFSEIFFACILQFPEGSVANSWAGFEFTVFSLIPMVIIALCYYKVSKTIQQHNQNVLGLFRGSNSTILSVNVQEIKITKTLFGLVFAFFACMFTGFILVVVCRVVAGSILSSVGFLVSFLISLTTAINPILYACTSLELKREFILILKCKPSTNDVVPAISWSR